MEPVKLKTPEPEQKPKKLYPPILIAAGIFFVAMIIGMLSNWKQIEDYNVEAPYMPYVGLIILVGSLIATILRLRQGKG